MGRSADIPRVAGRTDGDDTGCTILHVDMDAFFASVEVRRRPELRGKPVIVGGSTRGVVAAASYEARRFGVRSAMPMGQALRLCRHAVVLPPDRAAYAEASGEVMAILRDITPRVEPLSLDEAFLDVTGALRLLGPPLQIARAIRARVAADLSLTCSVGIAATKFVAKLASARCKPDGLLLVPAAETLEFLHPLPITVLWGVGSRTAQPLHRLGVRTVGDLAGIPITTLRRAVGVAVADHLHALAQGHDPREVETQDVEKSISADHTTAADLVDEADVSRELLRLCVEVGQRVRARGWVAKTVGIKIRFADFRTVTRVRTVADWVDSTAELHAIALELYRALHLDRPRIRLVGVKAEHFRDAAETARQPTLAEAAQVSPPGVDRVADATQERFGIAGLRPAALARGHARRDTGSAAKIPKR
jgi:DNA polymerase IV